MPLNAALVRYQTTCATMTGIITRSYTTDPGGNYYLNPDERSLAVESAFLRIFISWETFLEESFLQYMIGSISRTGRSPVRYVQPTSIGHARQMLQGLQRYTDWTTPDNVRTLSKNYFEHGFPFETVISSIHIELQDLKTIRNAAAHLSSTTTTQLDAVASRLLHTPLTGVSVSQLILSVEPGSTSGQTILMSYMSSLDAAAELIADA